MFVLRAYFLKENNVFQHWVNQIVKRGKGLDLGVEKIVLTLLLNAISEKLNFVLEMTTLSFIRSFICFLPYLF